MYKVLVVEDEPIIAEGIKSLLERCLPECHVIGIACDGQDGFEKTLLLKPDIVFTDIHMPQMNGIELIEKLKDDYKGRFVLLSGYEEFEYAKQAINLGVDGYVIKPIEEKEITEIFRKVFRLIDIDNPSANTLDDLKVNSGTKDIIGEIKKYIDKNFEKNIHLTDIAERFYINPYYFCQLFKKKMGVTYLKYITNLRISRAKRLLEETDLRIYEICELIGYTDTNHFNRVFESSTGFKPSEYRKISKAKFNECN